MKKVDTDRTMSDWLLAEVTAWDNDRPRSQQRTLGPSELGGCREYIRATVAGDPSLEEVGFKAAAFMGTAVGDLIENVFVQRREAITQREITTVLPRTGITVAGSADFIIPRTTEPIPYPNGVLVDVKSKDGVATVEREGASMENLIQISTYLVGAVQQGLLDADAVAVLMFVDRGGNDKRFPTVTVDYEEAQRWVDLAEDRLMDVQDVISRGSQEEDRWSLRDKKPSWCFAVQCGFRESCWGGSEHRPTGAVDAPEHIDAVRRYEEAMREEKDVASRKAQARKELVGITGITPTGTTVSWTSTGRQAPDGDFFMRLDVRPKR